jgi:hypothetical protein
VYLLTPGFLSLQTSTRSILLILEGMIRLVVYASELIWFIKSPKQRLETYCFCSVSYYYYSYSYPNFMSLSLSS